VRPEIIKFPPGTPVKVSVQSVEHYPYHWHDALEIIQVLKGSVNISMGGDNLLLDENGVAVINMDELHRVCKNQEENEILIIQIDDRFCRSILSDNSYCFIYCCSAYHEKEVPEKYRILKEHIARLIGAITGRFPQENPRGITDTLTVLLDYITYHFDFLRWGFGTRPFSEKRVKRLKQIAEHTKNIAEVQLRLKELAAEAGISLQHLSNDIKDKFGLTFQELLYYSMCEQAARLLIGTDSKIVDISWECGFSDPKYLVKHFKRNFNCTPSEFRKSYGAEPQNLLAQVKYREIPLSRALNYLSLNNLCPR
jgi:AraC-like DNA-binding protein